MNIKKNDIIYAIGFVNEYDNDADIINIIVDNITEEKAFGKLFSYIVYFHFENDHKKYYFRIKASSSDDVKLCKFFNENHSPYVPPNSISQYYLISDNKTTLIGHYIAKLKESIEYQQEVIECGLKTIKNLKNRISKFEKIKNYNICFE